MNSRFVILGTSALLVVGGGLYGWWQLKSSDSAVPESGERVRPSQPGSPQIYTPAVTALLSQEPVSLQERLGFLELTGKNLPPPDRLALLHAISNQPLPGLSASDWHTLVNDMLQMLRHQHPAMPEYTGHLIGLWSHRENDPTLRDYALQHLREWVADSDSRSAHETRPEQLAQIRQLFVDAVTPGNPNCDPQSTSLGTALLALEDWPGQTEEWHSQMQVLMLAHAQSAVTHRGVRATAIQLCVRHKNRAILPLCRELVGHSSEPVILRLAAISALGALGAPSDLTFLKDQLAPNERDPLLQACLRQSIQALAATPRP